MKNGSKLIPTEKYPYVKYYITSKTPLSASEKSNLYQKYLKNTINKLKLTWRTAEKAKLHDMAVPIAKKLTEDDIERQTHFKKVVINTSIEELELIPMIEQQPNFIKWGK